MLLWQHASQTRVRTCDVAARARSAPREARRSATYRVARELSAVPYCMYVHGREVMYECNFHVKTTLNPPKFSKSARFARGALRAITIRLDNY